MLQSVLPPDDFVRLSPPDFVTRQIAEWDGLRADVVTAHEQIPFEYSFVADHHLLIALEHAERDAGETKVEGLPVATCRHLSGRMTFVPAGHRFSGWQRPRVLTRVNFYYIDPRGPLLDDELRFDEIDFQPRLLFFDDELWRLAVKLRSLTVNGGARQYGEALSILLGHELIRLNRGRAQPRAVQGGLSGWQQRRVLDFMDAHLAEEVRLATMAELVSLSPYHFARAFKQSFGAPPHRYHLGRRIERAKTMLAAPEHSVTEIGRFLGFAETSSFSAAFRRIAGTSPRDWRRSFR
ncbi:MAG: AraC family transcriptional regulator [Pseudolabrys sp.]